MTSEPVARIDSEWVRIEAAIAENVNTLMHRTRMSATALASAVGMSKATLNRKLAVAGPWTHIEVVRIARFYSVSTDELHGTLPPLDEWRARRDSNPKPSDLESAGRPHLRLLPGGSSVKRGLTADRPLLWAVGQ